MDSNANPALETIFVLAKEARRHLVALTGGFTVIALVALPIILLMPKKWESSALLQVTLGNLAPLGANPKIDLENEVALLNQKMWSRKIQREVLAFGDLSPGRQGSQAEQQALDRLKARTRIQSPRPELIRITYFDADPERSYRITSKLAEIYIREERAAARQQSAEAFEFIDRQVTDYSAKLLDAHEKLLAYYREHKPEAATTQAPGAPISRPAATPQAQPAPVAVRPRPPPESAESQQAEQQLKLRLKQLESERSRLLGVYTEEHPEVQRMDRSLALVRDELRHAQEDRMARDKAILDAALGDPSEHVAPEQHARAGLPLSRSGPQTRVPAAEQAGDYEMRGVPQDTNLAELRRRYESMRDMYQDLLKRREAAHVSVDLSNEDRGVNIRIQEPPEVPAKASSMRLSQLSLAALAVAALLPLGALFARIQLDGRVRIAREIERTAKVKLLGAIPPARGVEQSRRNRRRSLIAAMMVFCVFAAYVTTFVLRLTQAS